MSAGWNAYTGPQDHIGGGAHEPEEEEPMSTKQIAEEAALEAAKVMFGDNFDDELLDGPVAQLTPIINAAIEKATEHDKQQIDDLKRQLESWMHTASRAQIARNEALEKLQYGENHPFTRSCI